MNNAQTILEGIEALSKQISHMQQRSPHVRYELALLWSKAKAARNAAKAMAEELEAVGAGGVESLRAGGDKDARIAQLEALLKFADERINKMREDHAAQLVAEAARTAEEKLRADQMTQQHAMQAKMHAQASEQLAAVQQGVQAPELFCIDREILADIFSDAVSVHEQFENTDNLLSYLQCCLRDHEHKTTHPTQLGQELDAARYQWLREQHDKGDDSVAIFIGDEQHGPGHLDAQIDEAIAAQAKQGGV